KELSAVLHVEAGQLQNAPERGGKGADRLALAVTYNPEQSRPKAGSPEGKRYMENPKPARKGVGQGLLVLPQAAERRAARRAPGVGVRASTGSRSRSMR